jgi:hypothetical protein
VRCLEGILKEVTVGPEAALGFYRQLLEADPSNSVCVLFPSTSLEPSCQVTEMDSQINFKGVMEARNLCA